MSRFSIKSVKAREIIDCRGYPTLQVSVQVESGALEIPGAQYLFLLWLTP